MTQWVLTWAFNGQPHPATIDARPNRIVKGQGNPGGNWVAMTQAEIDTATANTQAAWDTWQGTLPDPPPPEMVLTSPDGTKFSITVTDAGVVKGEPL
jgi:hypothetical protein